jgi:hypothetical protein
VHTTGFVFGVMDSMQVSEIVTGLIDPFAPVRASYPRRIVSATRAHKLNPCQLSPGDKTVTATCFSVRGKEKWPAESVTVRSADGAQSESASSKIPIAS